MKYQPLVSCIVPVYNADKYLNQGIDSLLNQSYENIEIILVDDHSTDDSWSICRQYANDNANVRIFKNATNSGGPLRGRERGILESNGEWITFMDCDDYVSPQYIENLIEATNNGVYDIAVTGHSRLYSDGRIEDFLWDNYTQTTNNRLTSFYKHFLKHDFWTDPTDTVGQNLIRASICKKTDLSKYSNRVYAEDTLMALAFLANSQNGVNFVDNHDFYWRQREGSGSHGGFSSTANQEEFFKACWNILHKKETYNKICQNTPLISVVIPVYNVEKYLRNCLDSVIKQSYGNLEIIVVNDGTEDNSQKIIEEYKKNDRRMVAIKQVNSGLNLARAKGVSMARGEYITFVDSDDYVDSNYVRFLFETIYRNDVDMAVCGFEEFTAMPQKTKYTDTRLDDKTLVIKNRIDALRYFLGPSASVHDVYQMTAWGKLYRADIIKATDWELANYRRNEDNLESLQWYSGSINGVAVSSERLYYYRQNPESITKTPQKNTDPNGKSLNYFEFLSVIYEKTIEYLNDETFNLEALNQLAYNNRVQLQNYFHHGWLTDQDIDFAADNLRKITDLYNQEIQKRDASIQQQGTVIQSIYGSVSWKLTKPLRKSKKLYNDIIKKFPREGGRVLCR